MLQSNITFTKPAQQSAGAVAEDLRRYFSPKGADAPGTLITQVGRASLPVLEQLWGTPLDALLMNLLPALVPSSLRITTGETSPEWVDRRVTVLVNDRHVIQSIMQECAVSLAGGHENGQRIVETLTLRGNARSSKGAI